MAGFFGLFDYAKPGKGVSKEDVDKHGIALFFDILGRRWGKFMLLNMLYLLFSIPAFLINWTLSAFIMSWIMGILGGHEAMMAASELSNQDFNLMFQILNLFISVAMLAVFGSGSPTAAMNYVMRKFVNDTHSWVWSDFWDNFKSNFLQGTICYIINTLVFAACVVAIMFYSFFLKGTMGYVITIFVTAIMIVFIMMQLYVYQIMASFELKIKDIYRNALMLTIGRLPINVIACLLTAGIFYLISLIMAKPFVLIIFLFVLFTYTTYIQLFITNNTVNKYLLEPSRKAQEEKESEED